VFNSRHHDLLKLDCLRWFITDSFSEKEKHEQWQKLGRFCTSFFIDVVESCHHFMAQLFSEAWQNTPLSNVHSRPAFVHGTTGATRTFVDSPPPVNKNLPHTGPRCVKNATEQSWNVIWASHAYCQLYRDLQHHATVLRINVWPGGDRLFGASSKSAPGARAPLAPPKDQPCVHSNNCDVCD
jgi:hypothetical protein